MTAAGPLRRAGGSRSGSTGNTVSASSAAMLRNMTDQLLRAKM